MKPCIHRQPHSDTHAVCLNTVDLLHNGTVPLSVCEVCPYATESPTRGLGDKVANTLSKAGISKLVKTVVGQDCGCNERADKLNSLLPVNRSIDNGRWAVAVTTAPRSNPTITNCITSVRKAGWEPTIFAEPNSIEIPNTSYRWNNNRLGVWHNWLKSVRWFINETKAEFFLSVQDDSLFHPDSRKFVESILWPSKRTGFISLYTPKHYSHDKSGNIKPTGVNKVVTNSLWGACALVMHRNVLELLLDHHITKSWLGVPPRTGDIMSRKKVMESRKADTSKVQNSDTAIGKLMNAMRLDMYFVDPSPVRHIATHSAIGHGGNDGRRNCMRCADHTKPLTDQVFSSKKATK